jgi:hypothetical protein
MKIHPYKVICSNEEHYTKNESCRAGKYGFFYKIPLSAICVQACGVKWLNFDAKRRILTGKK